MIKRSEAIGGLKGIVLSKPSISIQNNNIMKKVKLILTAIASIVAVPLAVITAVEKVKEAKEQ